MTDTLESTDLEHVLDTTGMVPRTSTLHELEGAPTHAAVYYAAAPCGNILTVCEERRRRCRHHDGWRCTKCGGHHPYNHIEFRRL